MIILNFLIIGLQQSGEQAIDIVSTVVPFIIVVLMFGLPTYFIAKSKGKKSFWYILSGIIPILSIILIIILLVTPSKEDKEKADRLNELEKEVAKLKDEKNKIE